MKRAIYNKEFGRHRDKPGIFSFFLAGIIKILPKIGPLKPLKFKAPTPEVEKLYIQSFDTVQLHYSNSLTALHSNMPVLTDKDFDTGKDTKPGEYRLTDNTYCDLVLKLAKKDHENIDEALKQNILHFFDNGVALSEQKEDKKEDVSKALMELKSNGSK
jgi:hypothetical protein